MAGKKPAPERTPVPTTFPFSIEFQKSLLRLLTEDLGFGNAAVPYLEPSFFENEVLGWAFQYLVRYREEYNAIPPLRVVMEEVRKIDPSVRPLYQATLETVLVADLSVEDWLRAKTLDFIKRNLFVAGFREARGLYNQGKVDASYDDMMATMDKIMNTAWEVPDREWLFDEFDQRLSLRLSGDPSGDAVSTGIPELDAVLGGGLSKGELGIWIGYPKSGKSTMLVNHGAQSVRRGNHNTAHFVLEGSRQLVANRYDTIFAQRAYHEVKAGNVDAQTHARIQYEYRMFKKKLVIRGFTERWDYTVSDLTEELRELKRLYSWVPTTILVDYGDLLRARGKGYDTETEIQRASFRDQKSLANRGYAVWTATQAQRPKKEIDITPEILTSRNVADCYDKVRVADFIGSLNQTKDERAAKQLRLYAELYRDNEAGVVIPVLSDFGIMTISTLRDPALAVGTATGVSLGYTKPAQTKARI